MSNIRFSLLSRGDEMIFGSEGSVEGILTPGRILARALGRMTPLEAGDPVLFRSASEPRSDPPPAARTRPNRSRGGVAPLRTADMIDAWHRRTSHRLRRTVTAARGGWPRAGRGR